MWPPGSKMVIMNSVILCMEMVIFRKNAKLKQIKLFAEKLSLETFYRGKECFRSNCCWLQRLDQSPNKRRRLISVDLQTK